MKLLMVDDQASVINGMLKGIPWDEIGFDEVFTAFNSFEAKAIFLDHSIDILLCDIEMPVENGIDLVKWIKEKNIKTECIFLTAHAEFEYAQEAIKMGSLDYILLPASYQDIENCVKKVIKYIEVNKEKDTLRSYGEIIVRQDSFLTKQFFREWIYGREANKDYKVLVDANRAPHKDTIGYFVLFQVIKFEEEYGKDDTNWLVFAYENMVAEVFLDCGQSILFTSLENSVYAVFVYSQDGNTMEYDELLEQLTKLQEVFLIHLKCRIACYTGNKLSFSDIEEQHNQLVLLMAENVLQRYQIYSSDTTTVQNNKKYSNRANIWAGYLRSGLSEFVYQEALAHLNKMKQNNALNSKNLREFFTDFLQMFYIASEIYKFRINELFSWGKGLNLYNNACKNVYTMEEFIEYFREITEKYKLEEKTEQSAVEEVIRYIHEHMDLIIKRDELAELVHLSTDHLARIFKAETGYSLNDFIVKEKMGVAKNLIHTTNLPISIISLKVGYDNFSYFSQTYKKVVGIPPTEERKNAAI
jgi:two-component system, response regulator YesN